jgi:hypothetical protein
MIRELKDCPTISDQVATVAFPKGSIDLDTQEDYQNFLKQIKKPSVIEWL